MKVIVMGPNGKMGQAIIQAMVKQPELEIVAGVGPVGRAYIGRDLGQVARLGYDLGILVVDDLAQVIKKGDLIIDFSTREASLAGLDQAVRQQKAYVCGTTGFSAAELQQFDQAAKKIPVLLAANTSRFVNVLKRLVKEATQLVGDQSDIEIVEVHDRLKRDAPSGTSKELGEVIAHERLEKLAEVATYGRAGAGVRQKAKIGYHSLRIGDVSSSHTVYFGGMGERLELAHHAYDFSSFAKGACDCAIYLADKPAGTYSVADVFQLA